MSESKSADEVFSILRNEAEKAVAASYQDGLRAGLEARGSKEQLQEQFMERITTLKADRRKSPAKLREIQREFVAAGLTEAEVDLVGPHPNWKGHRMGDGPPPSR